MLALNFFVPDPFLVASKYGGDSEKTRDFVEEGKRYELYENQYYIDEVEGIVRMKNILYCDGMRSGTEVLNLLWCLKDSSSIFLKEQVFPSTRLPEVLKKKPSALSDRKCYGGPGSRTKRITLSYKSVYFLLESFAFSTSQKPCHINL